jgi:peptidoglycan hydrolase CwlO-like protein
MKKIIECISKVLIIISIIIIAWICLINKDASNEYVGVTQQDNLNSQIEDLKFKNKLLEDDLDSANSKLDELQREYDKNEELIELLQDQLLSYGIEPFEL